MPSRFGLERTDSLRRLVEVTGLGIAVTYFFDPENGADRRRAARAWIAGTGGAAATAPAQEEPPAEPPAVEELLPLVPEEVVLAAPPEEEPAAAGAEEAPRSELAWPRWGWTLVVVVTVCALAAFGAIGVGIWAVSTHDSGDGGTPAAAAGTPQPQALSVLADPSAQRVAGSASAGKALLVVAADGTAALVLTGLPDLAAGRTYEAWVGSGAGTEPAGLFAGGPAVVALTRPVRAGDHVTVTEEPAAGASEPSGEPVVSVDSAA